MNIHKLENLIKIKNGGGYSHLAERKIPVYGSGGIICYVNNYLYDGEAILLPRKRTLDNIIFRESLIMNSKNIIFLLEPT